MEEEVKEACEARFCWYVSFQLSGAFCYRSSCTAEGTEVWVTAESPYNERVAGVENQIIADRLGTVRNANEMFRVFSKLNARFVRPKV